MSNKKLFTALIIALVALSLVLGSLFPLSPVEAAPGAIPTPASVTYSGDNTQLVSFMSAQTMTADTASTAFQVGQAEALDIQYTIDQTVVAGEANTVTLKLQFSNDNTNWTDGVNIVASNDSDVTNLLQFNNFGAWTRVHANVTNENVVTLTVIGLARR